MKLLEAYRSFEGFEAICYNSFDVINEFLLQDKYKAIFVAEVENELVGFIIFNQSFDLKGRSIFIEKNFIYDKFRGNGIGVSLFSKVLEYAIEHNIENIKWTVSKNENQYLPIYKEMGANIISNKATYEFTKKDLERISENKIEFNSDLFKIKQINNRNLPEIKYFLEENSSDDKFDIDIYNLMKYALGENPLFKILFVEVENKIVGLMTYFDYFSPLYGKSSHIQCTNMKDDYKGIGLGKILNVYLMNELLKENYNRLTIDIDKKDDFSLRRMTLFNANKNINLLVEMHRNSLRNLINNK